MNIIQTFQYKNYILNWGEMDKEMYWKVFLRTEDQFKGLVWKRTYDFSQYKTLKEITIGMLLFPGKRSILYVRSAVKKYQDFKT